MQQHIGFKGRRMDFIFSFNGWLSLTHWIMRIIVLWNNWDQNGKAQERFRGNRRVPETLAHYFYTTRVFLYLSHMLVNTDNLKRIWKSYENTWLRVLNITFSVIPSFLRFFKFCVFIQIYRPTKNLIFLNPKTSFHVLICVYK